MKRKTTHQHVVFQEPGRPKKVDRVEKPVDDSKKYWFTRRDIHKFAADGSEKRNKKKFELMELMRLGAMPVHRRPKSAPHCISLRSLYEPRRTFGDLAYCIGVI